MDISRVVSSDADFNEERRRDTAAKQTVAVIAVALIIAGQIGIDEVGNAIAKAKEVVSKAGLNP